MVPPRLRSRWAIGPMIDVMQSWVVGRYQSPSGFPMKKKWKNRMPSAADSWSTAFNVVLAKGVMMVSRIA